jgi:hypothetical protein
MKQTEEKLNNLSEILHSVAKASSKNQQTVVQLVLPEATISTACIGHEDGTASLAISISESEMDIIGPLDDVNGIEFYAEVDTVAAGRWFLVRVVEPEDLPLFGHIADDVAKTVLRPNRHEALVAFGEMIRRWLNLFRRARRGLSQELQIGLWGELKTLILAAELSGWAQAVESWAGPKHAAQDFHFGSWAIEVKTTMHPQMVVKVSSLEQLDNSPWEELYIVHRTVRLVSTSEAPSLKATVDNIRVALPPEDATRREFEASLLAIGYQTAHEHRYGRKGIYQEAATTYRIEEGFPRILRDDVHAGVRDARYRIDLRSAGKFLRDPVNILGPAGQMVRRVGK